MTALNGASLRQLAAEDGEELYDMLQEIGAKENGFKNPCHGQGFGFFESWINSKVDRAKGINVPANDVPQTTYWLYVGDTPVGLGTLRHYLTDSLTEQGGHIGYAIRSSQRRKGYGSLIVKLLVEEAVKMGIKSVLILIYPDNEYSIKAALNNGGVITKITDTRAHVWIDCARL